MLEESDLPGLFDRESSHFTYTDNVISKRDWDGATKSVFRTMCTSQRLLNHMDNSPPAQILPTTLFQSLDTNNDKILSSSEFRTTQWFTSTTASQFRELLSIE